MIGGLLSKSSRVALLAVAGVFVGGMAVPSAKAADLGGDCCADLEERVAELEATTARKGNRKMSLTVYGQVNRSIVYWNDGRRSNTVPGLDNHNSASRFGFMGSAKISPAWSAGYSILLDWGDKGRTSGFNQINEDGATRGNPGVTRNEDGQPRMRDVNFWIEHKAAGRLTMGRLTNSGQNGLIDLAGTSPGVGSDPACVGGGLAFRSKTGAAVSNASSATTISALSFGCGGPIGIRTEGIKYTSPAFAGFIFDATIGEALKTEYSTIDDPTGVITNYSRVMGFNLKYAGEMSGFRVAAGVGGEWSQADEDGGKNYAADSAVVPLGGVKFSGAGDNGWGILPTNASQRAAYLAGALSLFHVPSGLFAQGHYTKLTIDNQVAAGGTKGSFEPGKDAHRWDIQGGYAKNILGIGNSVFYGEYGHHDNFRYSGAVDVCTSAVPNSATASTTCSASVAPTQLKGDKMNYYGLGYVQNVDAAAMELYVSWRHFTAFDPGKGAISVSNGNNGTYTAAAVGASNYDAVDIIMAGARVKF